MSSRPQRPPQPPPLGPQLDERWIYVLTNYFPFNRFPSQELNYYDVAIRPEPRGNLVRRQREIIDKLQTYVAPQVFSPRAAYDGRGMLISSVEIPSGMYEVNLSNRPPTAGQAPRGRFEVHLSLVKTLNPRHLWDYVNNNKEAEAEALQMLYALDVIFRQAPILKYPHNARSFFTPAERQSIGAHIELWRGIFQSVRPCVGRVLVNVDTATAAFWKPLRILDVCMDVVHAPNEPRNVRRLIHPSPRIINKLQAYLKNVGVSPRHRLGPVGGRKIRRIDPRGADEIVITVNGVDKTLEQFYWDTYNIRLAYPKACCIYVSETVGFPIELLDIAPNQFYKHTLPGASMDEVLRFSAKRPEERLEIIKRGWSTLEYGNSDYLRQAGIGVDNTPVTVRARVLPAPEVEYQGKEKPKINNGVWNSTKVRFFVPASLTSWVIVSCVSPDPRARVSFPMGTAEKFRKTLSNVMRTRGMYVGNMTPPIEYINPQILTQELERLRIQHAVTELFVVVGDGSSDLYYQIKHFGDIVTGIATQINPKLGGINHVPTKASVPWLDARWQQQRAVIVFGADTTHPAPNEGEKPTICGLASSMDQDASVYKMTMSLQRGRVEIIENLTEMVKDGLRAFRQYQFSIDKQREHIIPKHVLFFRDGVGEGQFREVCKKEVEAVREAFGQMFGKKISPPSITFIVVGKRHHTRFFPANPRDADKSGNAPAGLVVDTDIVNPHRAEFFLLSHGGLKGTSRPMHGTVVANENGMTKFEIQDLTNAMTYNFARATRSVSIPSPIYYAHIACGRKGIHFDPAIEQSDSASASEAPQTLQQWINAWQDVHPRLRDRSYFM